MAVQRRSFGSVRRLPSGRFQARYTGPDGRMHSGPETYRNEADARAFLTVRESEILRATWDAPTRGAGPPTFQDYAAEWLAGRPLKPSTRALYADLLDDELLPAFGPVPIDRITAAEVRAWHSKLAAAGRPTRTAHSYALLRTICGTAVTDDLLDANPCRVRGAGTARRVKTIRPASIPELEAITAAMPARYQAMVMLTAWCALRFGEAAELRRRDVDLEALVLHVRRGVVRVDGEKLVGTPKSDAGIRDVNVPPHLRPMLAEHLRVHAETGRDGLLFPARGGGHLAPSSLYRVFYPAREAAGRPDLRWHDLRHTGAVLAAATGATLAELMARLGHATPSAALRYQHAAADRDRAIADALSALVTP